VCGLTIRTAAETIRVAGHPELQSSQIRKYKLEIMRPPIITALILIITCCLAISQCFGQQTSASSSRVQIESTGKRSSNGNNNVRVLLIGDSDRRHAIEEASSLSLDLPVAQSGSPQDANNNSTNESGGTGAGSASGYQQHSLAALTLSQRHRSFTERSPTASTPPQDDPAASRRPAQEITLNEIDLPRIRPSWLNVSSRFKITGSSIDEIEFMMPAEYYLRQAFDAPVLLKTKLGILEGVRSIKFNKHLYTFLGVPYAKPPVEELRFKVAQPVERWDGVLQATKWPPFCVQPSMTLASKSSPVHPLTQMMSEDCLYLNIWTPSLKFNKNHKRPVMVWIHGGAFQYGGISVDENDGSALALAGDVVVVTMNYRISAFGFLNANNPQNGPNNVGLLDQRAALEWVHNNIKQFGGDPQQVTLFGESAGGHSVGLHMISPGSQPFFKRAIMQSGVPISYLRSYDVNSDNKGSILSEAISSVMMAKRLKCYMTNDTFTASSSPSSTMSSDEPPATTTEGSDSASSNDSDTDGGSGGGVDDGPILNDETLECMRKKSSLEILKAMGAPGNAGFFPTGNDQKGFFPHGPIMDSFDPDDLKVGPQKDYLIGTNTDEGTFMLHYGMPALFPSRAPPKVSSIEALKEALQDEINKMANQSETSTNTTSDLQSDIRSASGSQNRGAQAHLYRPLLKTSTSVLENFMSKSSQPNGTQAAGGNTSVWTKEAEFGKNVGGLITDIIFLCPARSLAKTLAEAGRNVYFYLYSHRSSLTPYHEWLGVTHHDEVEFVFGRPLRLADVYSGKDIEMSQRLIKIWSHFAYTGQALDQFGVKWPKYGAEDNEYMILTDDSAQVGERYHDRVCNVYDTVISVHLQDT
jgi:carboxylesterase type B